MYGPLLRHLRDTKRRGGTEGVGSGGGRRLRWLSRHAHHGRLPRFIRTVNLDQLEDSRRPLLFSLLPRMLRSDGSTPRSLQGAFESGDRDGAPARIVSGRRWRRALATSFRLAAGRAARERDAP